jgi:hypothetical protein
MRKIVIDPTKAKKAFVVAIKRNFPELRISIDEVFLEGNVCTWKEQRISSIFLVQGFFEPFGLGNSVGGHICITLIAEGNVNRHPRTWATFLSIDDCYAKLKLKKKRFKKVLSKAA